MKKFDWTLGVCSISLSGWAKCSALAAEKFREVAEELDIRRSAPKGAFDFGRVAVSLKRYPDTELGFLRSLLER